MESKKEKFIRLGESRTNAVLQKLQLIGNLSNRRNYDYSKEEVSQLFKAIEKELQNTKKLFEAELSKEESKFHFTQKR